jgi:hypothetical protein
MSSPPSEDPLASFDFLAEFLPPAIDFGEGFRFDHMSSHTTIGTGRHKASARGGNPSRSAKTVANSNLVARATMALVADNDADVTNGVTVGGATVGISPMPPLWNAWWCGSLSSVVTYNNRLNWWPSAVDCNDDDNDGGDSDGNGNG